MKGSENIYLIGLMGVGKTTIGRQLARSLKRPFFDSDKAIEEKTGVDIPTIFEYEGEEGFRQREMKVIKQLTEESGIILATGGGAVIKQQNRELLKANGFVVYLYCSVEKIIERTRKDTQRPLLNTDNPRKKIELLIQQRHELYLDCADYKIDTGKKQGREVIKNIIKAYRTAGGIE